MIDGEIGFTLVSELTAVEPEFILSCNSTDGPATSVIWTRNSDTVGEGTTVLNDAVTAQYTHTLTVTGRLGGVYVCTVSNSISTTASSGQNIEGTYDTEDQGEMVILVLFPYSCLVSYKLDGDSRNRNLFQALLDSSLSTGRHHWLHHLLHWRRQQW